MSTNLETDHHQKLIEEFMKVTEADQQTAEEYLDRHSGDVVQAINDYFEWMRLQYCEDEEPDEAEAANDKATGKNKHNPADEKIDQPKNTKKIKSVPNNDNDNKNSGNQSIEAASGNQKKPLRLFRHVTYNIDSLNPKNLKLRVQSICKILLQQKVIFVFFQEVRQESEIIIREQLSEHYRMYSGQQPNSGGDGDPSIDYYTMILVAKQSWIKVDGSEEIIQFIQTSMGRNILRLNVMIDNHAKICLMNTHLESTRQFETIRKQQLRSLLKHFETIDKSMTIICAGDMNVRDKELDAIGGLPSDVQDAWIATGSRKEVQYTWDMMRNDNIEWHQPGSKSNFKPRMRFDRVWIRRSQPVKIDLIHFGLIGIERLKPHVCFPSDHWGVITSYQVYENNG